MPLIPLLLLIPLLDDDMTADAAAVTFSAGFSAVDFSMSASRSIIRSPMPSSHSSPLPSASTPNAGSTTGSSGTGGLFIHTTTSAPLFLVAGKCPNTGWLLERGNSGPVSQKDGFEWNREESSERVKRISG